MLMTSGGDNNTHVGIPECWEYMDCPEEVCRECIAHPHLGRECWKLTGTKCAQGRFDKAELSEKITYCREHCKYFKKYFSDKL
jgi:hypothetical protein